MYVAAGLTEASSSLFELRPRFKTTTNKAVAGALRRLSQRPRISAAYAANVYKGFIALVRGCRSILASPHRPQNNRVPVIYAPREQDKTTLQRNPALVPT